MFPRLSGFQHQFAHTNRLFGREDRLNDAINIKRHLALERLIVAIRAERRRHIFDLNVQAITAEVDIGCAGRHCGAAF